MSQLAAARTVARSADDSPAILAFPAVAQRLHAQDVLTRARLQHRNKCCHQCGRATVEPVELEDSLLDRRGMAIPGTATLVGFFCNACRHDWATTTERLKLYVE